MIAQNKAKPHNPSYVIPLGLLLGVMWSVLWLKPRSISHDAVAALKGVRPPVKPVGLEHIPVREACVVVCNHYSRPGFAAWWITLAISALVAGQRAESAAKEILWVITSAWTFPESTWRRRVLTPITRWAFVRVAKIYNFISMPPMPPVPEDMQARSAAVLRTVRLAKSGAKEGIMIGLAPEGQDAKNGLAELLPSSGDFIALLVKAGLAVLPVGLYEAEGELNLSFGQAFFPELPVDKQAVDHEVAQQVMVAIAAQLPPGLTGAFK